MPVLPELTTFSPLGSAHGLATMCVVGAVLLCLVYYVKLRLVSNTKDFVIANRKIGFGMGVAGLISIWTWSMAMLMSSGLTYEYGLSGLFWFTVPNGLAVIMIIPFAKKIRQIMPEGYTIAQFISVRYDYSKAAAWVVTIGMLFGSIIEITLNIKGASLVANAMFGLDPNVAAMTALIIVLIYSLLGGLWASITNATLVTLFRGVFAAVIIIAIIQFVGGPEPVWEMVKAKDPMRLSVMDVEVAAAMGITLALGILTASLAGQEFWQVVWGMKKKEVSRTFLWAGAWFYPIPICFGLLGLIGYAMGIDLQMDLHGDGASVAPYLVSHLGLPVWFIYVFAAVILTASYATIDAALCGFSSTFAVNIIRPFFPNLKDMHLLIWAKASMLIAAAIAASIVLTGASFNKITLITYALRTAILIPLMMSIFWGRMTRSGFVYGTALSIVGWCIVKFVFNVQYELWGTMTILGISFLVPYVLGLMNQKPFDFGSLNKGDEFTKSDGSDSDRKPVISPA